MNSNPSNSNSNNSNKNNNSNDKQSSNNKPRKGGWNPYYYKRKSFVPPKEKPTTLQIRNTDNNSEVQINSTENILNSNQQELTSLFINKKDDNAVWHLYFTENTSDNSVIERRVKFFEQHFTKYSDSTYDLTLIKSKYCFELKLQFLLADDDFRNSWTTFQNDLIENPVTVLSCAGLSMHNLIIKVFKSTESNVFSSANSILQTFKPRLYGFGPLVNLKSLRASNYNHLIAIRGTVIRAGSPEILCIWMAFKCNKCNMQQVVKQIEGAFTTPTSCRGQCRNRSHFTPLLTSPYTCTEAFQTIRLQESMLGEQYDSGRVPRNIEIELSEDLVDSVCPGDDIVITGILKIKPQQDSMRRKDQANIYKMFVKAVSVSNSKNTICIRKSEFTEKDMRAINVIQNEPNVFRLLLHSLFPSIYGHEMIKAGLLLALFGASNVRPGKRNEIHVLVVGDPGVGKSQMLQSCANISPRGIFVCGKSSSNAGLTVAVRHEKGSGNVLEAGALVLADQGVCCIDEFDKMSSNYQSLLEVMEQQTISLAKAGVICSVPARTSILAAANPVGGHFDRSKTVSENLKMNPALLSRFDLIFLVLDTINSHLDSLLTSYVQGLRSGTKKVQFNWSCSQNENLERPMQDNSQSLTERLRLLPNENIDLLPQILLQKYIAYARKNIHPRLTKGATEEIKKFYLNMRKTGRGLDTFPVTTRQLEGLIRLTQARARLELSPTATVEHVLDVLEIVQYTLNDALNSDSTEIQLNHSLNSCGGSQSSQIKRFMQMLQRHSSAVQKTIFDVSELKEVAASAGVVDFTQVIDSLNMQGVLLRKGQNIYKFVAI